MRALLSVFLFLVTITTSQAQLKFLIEDFEGCNDGSSDLRNHGLYSYGKINALIDSKSSTKQTYSGNKCMRIEKNSKVEWAGWGKGITSCVDLDFNTDHLNFYFMQPASNETAVIRIDIQDDDNNDNTFTKEKDDCWLYTYTLQTKNAWELVSIPLSRFSDSGPGGDNYFNISYKHGKILGLMISFVEPKKLGPKQDWYFDFFCFSKGKLPTGANIFEPAPAAPGDFCTLGAWSDGEGKAANFIEIAKTFESNFGNANKKIGIVHFFQPFGKDDGSSSLYPSAERINRVIEAGYIPMITLENHFITAGGKKQPNLYSITEGHFDSFLGYWAHLIKDVKGTVLLRILHEFNGDWYDWCTVKNDKNPQQVAKAFRYIHNIFNQNNVRNVKFIWCPNSMSVPQESWNNIVDAYPGDEYVDFVGLDIYNGAGNNQAAWRSFRKEGIEMYYTLTQNWPTKPLLIVESASRERRMSEAGQSKADWIKEMSTALKTDMSKIRLLAWFNATDPFKLNSSSSAKESFINNVLKDPYFRSGKGDFEMLLRK